MEIGNVLQLIDKVRMAGATESKVADLKIGDLIKATVLSIDRDNMLLDLGGGRKLMATDQSQVNYNIGDKVQFQVTDKKGDALILKNMLTTDEVLNSKLQDTGISIKNDVDIKEGIKLFIENEIPLTKENLEGLETSKGVKLLNNILSSETKVDAEKLTGLKDQLSQSDIKGVIKEILLAELDKGSSIKDLPQFNNLDKVLSDFSVKDLVFMIKNNVPLSLSNVVSHMNLIQGKNDISSQLDKLVNVLDKQEIIEEPKDKADNPKKSLEISDKAKQPIDLGKVKEEIVKLKNSLNDLDSKDIKKNIRVLKDITEKLDNIKKEIPLTNELNKAFDDIKITLDFMNSFEDNTAYMQIPINTNGNLNNVELFISKNKNNSNEIDKDNCNIYISLDTFNIGRVNTLIEINNGRVDLSFATENDRVKAIFKSKEKVIMDRIDNLGLNVGIIRYKIDHENSTVVDFNLRKESKLNNLDIRV